MTLSAFAAQREQNKRGEDELGLPANLGLRKSPHRPDETNSGRLQRNGLRIHELSVADPQSLSAFGRAYSLVRTATSVGQESTGWPIEYDEDAKPVV